jgi:hypothetical protein
MSFVDEGFLPYATEAQWKYYCAVVEHGSHRKAAAALSINKGTIGEAIMRMKRKAADAGYSPEYDLTHPVPDGFKLKGTSTLYSEDGAVKVQWVKSEADKARQVEMIKEATEEMVADLPALPPKPVPDQEYSNQLMSVIPFGDPHFGLYCWADEVGEDFDLGIAKRDLCAAVDYLVSQSPASERCVIVNLGDFFHYDNASGTTSKGTILDVDSRIGKVIRVGVSAMRQCIETALERHRTVEVINAIGNHDEVLSMALSVMLANIYENEPRVIVHNQPTRRHYIQHGKVLLGITHGDKTKDRDLPGIMATERPEEWGKTLHRYWYRGHLHHDGREEFNGCMVEQFRTLAPGDSYSVGHGWLSGKDMKLIVHHMDYGEVARTTCSIAMLRDLRNV